MSSRIIAVSNAAARADDIAAEAEHQDSGADHEILRRQIYTYDDLLIQIEDIAPDGAWANVPTLPALQGVDPARCYYEWNDDTQERPVTRSHKTLIVNRLASEHLEAVAGIFGAFDATDMPHKMGTRHRQLFTWGDVYFHVQDFDSADGSRVIDHARPDPRFVKICEDLDAYIRVYDPATWHEPADAIAVRVYSWARP